MEHGVRIPVFDQRGELPLLPFGYPIRFVPASRGGVYIKSNLKEFEYRGYIVHLFQFSQHLEGLTTLLWL